MEFSRLVYLLGAGASVRASVPDFARVWRDFEQNFGLARQFDSFPRGITGQALREVQAYVDNARKEEPSFNDFEALCKHLHTTYSAELGRIGPGQRADADLLNTLRGLLRAEFSIRRRFVDLVDIDFDDLDHREKLVEEYKRMLDWAPEGQPVDIFTLNNDLLIEWLCSRWRVSLADGFDRQGCMDSRNWACYKQPGTGIRLYKLHGSINWYRTNADRPIEKRASQKTLKGLLKRETAEIPVLKIPLIWPGIYDELEDISVWRDAYLATALEQARCVIIAGYKLGDVVIRNIVCKSLRKWPRPTGRKVFVVCGDRKYEEHLANFIQEMNTAGQPVAVAAQGDTYKGGYFPNVLQMPIFREQVQAALATG